MVMNPEMQRFIEERAKSEMPASEWFYIYNNSRRLILKVYLRAGRMMSYTDKDFTLGLTISNITVYDLRQGLLTQLAAELRASGTKLGYTELRVENAHGPEMVAFCEKEGFLLRESSRDNAACFYQLLKGPHDQEN